jgi:hypothetical protein
MGKSQLAALHLHFCPRNLSFASSFCMLLQHSGLHGAGREGSQTSKSLITRQPYGSEQMSGWVYGSRCRSFSTKCRVSEAMLAGFLGALCLLVGLPTVQTARLCSLELVLHKYLVVLICSACCPTLGIFQHSSFMQRKGNSRFLVLD